MTGQFSLHCRDWPGVSGSGHTVSMRVWVLAKAVEMTDPRWTLGMFHQLFSALSDEEPQGLSRRWKSRFRISTRSQMFISFHFFRVWACLGGAQGANVCVGTHINLYVTYLSCFLSEVGSCFNFLSTGSICTWHYACSSAQTQHSH